MRNFNLVEIIGDKKYQMPGSKFDSADDLFRAYFALLFFTLKDGITYSTGRNGLLARVKFERRGFVNYVQPSIAIWDYTNPKLQRVVSPDFVLYLFNKDCMEYAFSMVNSLNELGIEKQIDLTNVKVENIIKLYEEYEAERVKSERGEPNYYTTIDENQLAFVNMGYMLVKRVTKYSKEYLDAYLKFLQVAEADRLRDRMEEEGKDYGDLTEAERKILDNEPDINFDDRPFYLSLGTFYDFILSDIIKGIYKTQRKTGAAKSGKSSEEIALLDCYEDPVKIMTVDGDEITDIDEIGPYDLEIEIDYENAKEFAKEGPERLKER